MSDHLEYEVANHHNLIRDLMTKVGDLEKTKGGLLMAASLPSVLPGPGASVVSRAEFTRMRDGLVGEIEALKAELAAVSDLACEAVRVLDRMSGMGSGE